jgi:hypothetical protein
MNFNLTTERHIGRALFALGLISFVIGVAFAIVAVAARRLDARRATLGWPGLEHDRSAGTAHRNRPTARAQGHGTGLAARPTLQPERGAPGLRSRPRPQRRPRVQGRRPRRHRTPLRTHARRNITCCRQGDHTQDAFGMTCVKPVLGRPASASASTGRHRKETSMLSLNDILIARGACSRSSSPCTPTHTGRFARQTTKGPGGAIVSAIPVGR